MSRKPRSDNSLITLSPAQREILTSWLFDDNISYQEAVKRCKREFGIGVGKNTLEAFYYRERQSRSLRRIAQCTASANKVVKELTDRPADTYRALIGMAGQIAFEKAFDSEKQLDRETICEFTKLLIAARKDDREARKFSLEREKWEFDAAEACLGELPELKVISTDTALSQKEKLRQVRLRLFGVAPE